MNTTRQLNLNILLADDDIDDRYFFAKALASLPFATSLHTVDNGALLMTYLDENIDRLPDVLFLDLNMPKKNGASCLVSIKEDEKLKHLPVIIYSTSLHSDIADLLYKNGAHFYIKKTEFQDLKKVLQKVLPAISAKRSRPSREEFVFSLVEV